MVAQVGRVTSSGREQAKLNLRSAQARWYVHQFMQTAAERRQELGMSQTELARRMGTTQSAVSDWETGLVVPQMDNVVKMCLALDIPFRFGGVPDIVQRS